MVLHTREYKTTKIENSNDNKRTTENYKVTESNKNFRYQPYI